MAQLLNVMKGFTNKSLRKFMKPNKDMRKNEKKKFTNNVLSNLN